MESKKGRKKCIKIAIKDTCKGQMVGVVNSQANDEAELLFFI